VFHLLRSSFLFLIATSSYASFECKNETKIRMVKNGQEIEKAIKLCQNHNVYDFISYDCLKNKNCLALKKYENNKKLKLPFSKYKNPFHYKCSAIGGKPEMLSYLNGTKWVNSARCLFPDDSFISVFNKIR